MDTNLIRSIRGSQEFPLNARPNTSHPSYDRSMTKDSTSTQVASKNIFKNSPAFSSNIKDPAVKGRRYDYLIFFNKKISSKLDSTPKTSCRKCFSPYPARYCSVNNSSSNGKKKLLKHVNDDLKLIRDINFDSDMHVLELDKLYRNYILSYQAPTGIERSANKTVHRNRHKKVRFNVDNK